LDASPERCYDWNAPPVRSLHSWMPTPPAYMVSIWPSVLSYARTLSFCAIVLAAGG
jgi:hypothetical protein